MGVLDAIKKGLLSGAEMYGAASQPAAEEVIKGAIGFTPGIGDAISAYDAYDALKQGNYGEATLNGVGLLPFVPSLGGVIKKVGNLSKTARYPSEIDGLVIKGLGGLPESKTWDVAGNVFADMSAQVRPMTDRNYVVRSNPIWGRKNKPFYAVGDDPEELASYAIDRIKRGDAAIQGARTAKVPKDVRSMLEERFGKNFSYDISNAMNSNSYYITHNPSGKKIRVSDHDLPNYYENTADLDIRHDELNELPSFLDKLIGLGK